MVPEAEVIMTAAAVELQAAAAAAVPADLATAVLDQVAADQVTAIRAQVVPEVPEVLAVVDMVGVSLVTVHEMVEMEGLMGVMGAYHPAAVELVVPARLVAQVQVSEGQVVVPHIPAVPSMHLHAGQVM